MKKKSKRENITRENAMTERKEPISMEKSRKEANHPEKATSAPIKREKPKTDRERAEHQDQIRTGRTKL